MNRCQQTDTLLSAFIEGETSPAETRFLQSHFASCPRCRREKTELESLLANLHALPRVETSEGFTARVLARTSGLRPAGMEAAHIVPPPPSRMRWAVPMAAAAAVLVMVWGATRLTSTGSQAPEMASNPPETKGLVDELPVDDPTPSPEVVAESPSRVETVSLGEDEGKSVWLDGDAYVLENYELREPAGGGTPTLTRASANAEDKVVVTF